MESFSHLLRVQIHSSLPHSYMKKRRAKTSIVSWKKGKKKTNLSVAVFPLQIQRERKIKSIKPSLHVPYTIRFFCVQREERAECGQAQSPAAGSVKLQRHRDRGGPPARREQMLPGARTGDGVEHCPWISTPSPEQICSRLCGAGQVSTTSLGSPCSPGKLLQHSRCPGRSH